MNWSLCFGVLGVLGGVACAHGADAPGPSSAPAAGGVAAPSTTAPVAADAPSSAPSPAGNTSPADPAPAGAGVAPGPAGATCGGIAGLRCQDRLFCDYPVGAHCGAADQTGTCQPKPEMCTRIYKAVCGCDGKTYGNACEAHSAGISIASESECGKP